MQAARRFERAGGLPPHGAGPPAVKPRGRHLRLVSPPRPGKGPGRACPPRQGASAERIKNYKRIAKESATRSRLPWTSSERKWLMENRHSMRLVDLALTLGRTYDGIIEALAGLPSPGKGLDDVEEEMEGNRRLRLADILEGLPPLGKGKGKGIGYARAASAVGVGRSTLHRLATTGQFPVGERFSDLKARIENLLTSKGLVDAKVISTIWEPLSNHNADPWQREKEGRKMHNRRLLGLETLEYFSLARDPFAIDKGGVNAVFESKEIKYVMRSLSDCLRNQGWMALCGDIGSGKSTIVKTWMSRARDASSSVRFWRPGFADPKKLTVRAIMEWIARDHDQTPRSSHTALQSQIEKLLVEEAREGHQVCLVIEEAHHIANRTLSGLKALWESEDPERPLDRLFSIVLIGQPPLRKKLESNYDVREVAERTAILNMPEPGDLIPGYLRHRLRQAGGSPDAIVTEGALSAVADQARTFLEAGNILSGAMEKAARNGQEKVDKDWVVQVTSEEASLHAAE